MLVEWDESKSEWNLANRGFDFRYASTVFLDSERLVSEPYVKNGEIRQYAIGQAVFGELLFIVFTVRSYENYESSRRIISARVAHKSERERYTGLR